MERKHQVFVSSTYKDLIEERQQVMHALLELDCIPVGMELFPATDEDAWTLIKEVIDNSDYYLLIIAGKYGSCNPEGISYTEMEFNYAVEISKPIICFLHQNIDELTRGKTESLEPLQKKLSLFKDKAQAKHCKFWKTPEDLGGKVSRSLVQLKKRHPSDGWIPGKYAADERVFRKIEEYSTRILELETEKENVKIAPPPGAKNLAKGKETYGQEVSLVNEKGGNKVDVLLEASWDKIFSYAGTAMIGECSEDEFQTKVKLVYWHSVPSDIVKFNSHEDIIISYMSFDSIKVQLQALGLISHGTKKRAVSDTNTYWKLTPYGEKYLLKVRAIKTSNEA